MNKARCMFCALLCWTISAPVRAENWPQWRGPWFNGSSGEKGLPTNWTKESAVWVADMPGPAAATPIIWEDLVFISTVDAAASSLHARCLDRRTGKVLWDKTAGEGRIRLDDRSNFASPSPVVDAEHCFFFYCDGTMLGFDHAGRQIWSRSLTKEYGEFAMNWTFSSSPTLYDGKLYMQVLQRDRPARGRGRADGPIDSFLLVLDPATGSNLARVVRPTDALDESHDAYSTPIPFEFQGQKQILVGGGNYVTGHELGTGRELWRSPDLNPRHGRNWRVVTSPVASGGIVLTCAPQNNTVRALQPPGSGAPSGAAILWSEEEHREISTDVPTPAVFDGDFFVLGDANKTLSRLEPATGKIKWQTALPGSRIYQASPTAADGRIYLMNFAGDVVLVDAAGGAVLNTIAMGEPGDDQTRSTIAVSNGQLFIRTNHKLYCIGKK
jgi:outer membrane protein assembly factor BamB